LPLQSNLEKQMGILNEATLRVQSAVDRQDEAEAFAKGTAKFLETTSKYIAAHPLHSLGLAIAAGYLLGRITR
jgi:ElaB/YqjD/DUF883 family membrane-anchored ribosome-binding protein